MHVFSLSPVVVCLSFALTANGIEFPEPKGRPVCSTPTSLCGMDYRYVTEENLPIQLLHSDNEICRCPGNMPCAIGYEWSNMTNSFVQKVFTKGNHQLLVKISYCSLPERPRRPCGFNQPVLVSRGRGLFKFDIVGDILCSCNRPLVQRSGWIDQNFAYDEYGCGQPKCSKLNSTVCSEVTLSGNVVKSRYFCRCRRQEMCQGKLPETDGQSLPHTCELIH